MKCVINKIQHPLNLATKGMINFNFIQAKLQIIHAETRRSVWKPKENVFWWVKRSLCSKIFFYTIKLNLYFESNLYNKPSSWWILFDNSVCKVSTYIFFYREMIVILSRILLQLGRYTAVKKTVFKKTSSYMNKT